VNLAKALNKEDGTYLLTAEGSLNYEDRWAYGYLVATGPVSLRELGPGLLFGVWTDPEGHRHFDKVRHVDARVDAVKLAQECGQQAIYDLMEKKVVFVE